MAVSSHVSSACVGPLQQYVPLSSSLAEEIRSWLPSLLTLSLVAVGNCCSTPLEAILYHLELRGSAAVLLVIL